MNINLRPNRELLNTSFDTYKLSLDNLCTVETNITSEPCIVPFSYKSHFSIQHVKAYGKHNSLVIDPFNTSVVYYCDKDWCIQRIAVHVVSGVVLESAVSVFTIPKCRGIPIANDPLDECTFEKLNVTFQFASPVLACLSDGMGNLYVINTGKRDEKEYWEILHTESAPPNEASLIIDVKLSLDSFVDCITLRIMEKLNNAKDNDSGVKYKTEHIAHLDWLSFDINNNTGECSLTRRRHLESSAVPDFAVLEFTSRDFIHILCEKGINFVYDSLVTVTKPTDIKSSIHVSLEDTADKHENGVSTVDPVEMKKASTLLYTWSETDTQVTLKFHFSAVSSLLTAGDSNIVIKEACFDKQSINIKFVSANNNNNNFQFYYNGVEVLSGRTFAAINAEESTWLMTEQNSMLYIVLSKRSDDTNVWTFAVDPGTPDYLSTSNICASHKKVVDVYNDDNVLLVPNNSCASLLDNDTEETPIIIKSAQFGMQQLEECDKVDIEQEFILMRLCGNTHKVTHQSDVYGHQCLFTYPSVSQHTQNIEMGGDNNTGLSLTPPGLCLRHDVDGILWLMDSIVENMPWKHVATFNAMGYVQAGKENRLYSGCSPDLSCCVICDMDGHVFIYHTPQSPTSQLTSEVRNRKTGKVISSLARTHVVSLESCAGTASARKICGFSIGEHGIFVLTDRKLYFIKL